MKKEKINNIFNKVLMISVYAIAILAIVIGLDYYSNHESNEEKYGIKKVEELLVFKINNDRLKLPLEGKDFEKYNLYLNDFNADSDVTYGASAHTALVGSNKEYTGIILGLTNNTEEIIKVRDCDIDYISITSEYGKISFINGLDFNSTMDEVENTFDELGYKFGDKTVSKNGNVEYKYFLNDEDNNKEKYIAFNFYEEKLVDVTISYR